MFFNWKRYCFFVLHFHFSFHYWFFSYTQKNSKSKHKFIWWFIEKKFLPSCKFWCSKVCSFISCSLSNLNSFDIFELFNIYFTNVSYLPFDKFLIYIFWFMYCLLLSPIFFGLHFNFLEGVRGPWTNSKKSEIVIHMMLCFVFVRFSFVIKSSFRF